LEVLPPVVAGGPVEQNGEAITWKGMGGIWTRKDGSRQWFSFSLPRVKTCLPCSGLSRGEARTSPSAQASKIPAGDDMSSSSRETGRGAAMVNQEKQLATAADKKFGVDGWYWADYCDEDECSKEHVHSPNCRCS